MRVDDLVQFPPESALREMSSSSANAFPAISSAVLVLPSSDESFSFRACSFLFSARSRVSSSSPALFNGFPDVAGSVPFSLLVPPVLDMGVVQTLAAHQLAALRAAVRQRVVLGQDPRLVRRGERQSK